MNKQFSHVLAPIRINGKLIKNRLIVAPITPHSASNGEPYPNEEQIAYFEQRAQTGAGIVYCAGIKQVDNFDDGEHTAWDYVKFNHKNALAGLAARIHAQGALAGMEIHGILPTTLRPGPITCSDGNRIFQSPPIGMEMTKEEIKYFVEKTAEACATLYEVGFDSLLFHFGHSIPVAQFMSSLTNHRTDEYGGSLENRCRIFVEILDACRAATKGRMLMEIRMSATEFEEGGITLEEGIEIASILQDHCDIVQASCGMVIEKYMTWTHPCQHMPDHPNLRFAEAFKKSGKIHKPVTAIGAFESLAAAEEAIAEGKCDFVAMARSLIADPDMIKKEINGCADDVVPCVKCMRCHDSDCYEHLFRCTVNPRVGHETAWRHMFAASTTPKKVAIIGGGPAGMEAALTAKQRGHQVTLFEKSDALGGALKFANHVSFKYALARYKDFLVYQCGKQQIDVRLNTEVKPEDLNGQYDAVIIAVGADPLMLPIPGFDLEHGIVATDAYGNEDKLGDTIVVIGGGQVGCETALHLCEMGKKVSIVEMQSGLCPDASKTCADEIRIILDETENFTAILNAKCKEIGEGTVTYVDADGKEVTIPADTVIFSAGMKAKTELADSFVTETDIPAWAQVGDCVRARTVEQAVAEAYNAVMAL